MKRLSHVLLCSMLCMAGVARAQTQGHSTASDSKGGHSPAPSAQISTTRDERSQDQTEASAKSDGSAKLPESAVSYQAIETEQAMGSAGKQLFKNQPKDGMVELPPEERRAASDPNGFDEEQKAHTSSSTYLTMGILFMVSLLFLHKKSKI